MQARKKLRLKLSALSCAAIVAAVMIVPAIASADGVDDVLNGIGLGSGQAGQGSSGGSGGSGGTTKAGTPPNYVPPLHGTNPHGQGDSATVQFTPADTNPVSGNPGQPESIVVGSSRGEQNPDGSYHGHITIASLFGAELLAINTTNGQTASGPLEPLNAQLLDQICMQSTTAGFPICLTLLDAHSSTNGSGSTNNFSVATAQIGQGATNLVHADAVTSSGNISQDSRCQTASGQSGVANAGLLPADAISASVAQGSSSSTACNDGTAPSTTQNSSVINLQGAGTPIPAQGCENGTPNTNFTPLNPLISTVCNANDTSTGQTTTPYGVREALSVFVLAIPGGSAAIKAVTAGPESHAVAPPATTTQPPCVGANCPGGGNKGNQGGNNGNGNGNGNGAGNGAGSGAGAGSAAGNAGAGNGNLAFTGADLPWLLMLGLGLVGAGLALFATGPARRPRLNA